MVVNRLWHWYTETVYWPGRLFGSIFSKFPITWICFFFFFWSHRLSKNRWLTPLPLPGNKSSQIYWKKTTAEQREEADPSPNQTVSRRLLSKNMSTLSFPPVTTCSRRGSKYWFHTDADHSSSLKRSMRFFFFLLLLQIYIGLITNNLYRCSPERTPNGRSLVQSAWRSLIVYSWAPGDLPRTYSIRVWNSVNTNAPP